MEYIVRWEMTIEADSPEQAAREALKIQRDPDSLATMFTVKDENGYVRSVDAAEKS